MNGYEEGEGRVINMAYVMMKPASVAVKAGPDQVEAFMYEATQILAEICSHVAGGVPWQVKLVLLGDMLSPLPKAIEKHWRKKGKRLKVSITFHPVTGEPGILLKEPVSGEQRTLYARNK